MAHEMEAAGLASRIAYIRAKGDTSRRGVNEAIAEAERQFGFTDYGAVLYWMDEAECAAGLITARELNARLSARGTSTPLRWS
jgi:hypothetical protein